MARLDDGVLCRPRRLKEVFHFSNDYLHSLASLVFQRGPKNTAFPSYRYNETNVLCMYDIYHRTLDSDKYQCTLDRERHLCTLDRDRNQCILDENRQQHMLDRDREQCILIESENSARWIETESSEYLIETEKSAR